eukprot:TRINITY_DN3041_c0_g1_i5.p5 TRINITY_DN3041_c0_g1~~TRINITY_DN3041_c0_g1_i5.p5  ORF type:complete len:135 (+),score=0.66 TRINITY_DN3041_c0_g1_i5:1339-1743(+)
MVRARKKKGRKREKKTSVCVSVFLLLFMRLFQRKEGVCTCARVMCVSCVCALRFVHQPFPVWLPRTGGRFRGGWGKKSEHGAGAKAVMIDLCKKKKTKSRGYFLTHTPTRNPKKKERDSFLLEEHREKKTKEEK